MTPKLRLTTCVLVSMTVFWLPVCLHAQSIITVAGGGIDEELPATGAPLGSPSSVAIDASGNFFIADQFSHTIRRVDGHTGIITTFAGNGESGFSGDGGPATQASLDYPGGVAVDASGNLFIAESRYNRRIRRVDGATGIITTFAGNGSYGFSGDGGPATQASLDLPAGLAVDAFGNLFIADSGNNNRIRRVDGDTGIITTVAGNGSYGFSGDGGLATQASLYEPAGVAIDASGNLFIADQSNDRIRRVDGVTGIITTVAGNNERAFAGDGGPATQASLDYPEGVAVDTYGNLFIADSQNNRIRRVDGATRIITTIAGNGSYGFSGDGGPATQASLPYPAGVAVDASGNLLVADRANRRVRRVDGATGIIATVAGNGEEAFSGDGGPATQAALLLPASVAIDTDGNFFIADSENHRIRRVDGVTEVITTVAGNGEWAFSGDGGPATQASIGPPAGVAIDASGNLFFADQSYHRIRRVDRDTGTITTVAGNGEYAFSGDAGPATQASLHYPDGVAIDASGNLFIADKFNHRIRRVDGDTGIITTVAGAQLSSGFSGDGGPATGAALSFPEGVAIDGFGNLFIADSSNHRIRRVDGSTGTITTVAGAQLSPGFSGDGGPATQASLAFPEGVAIDGFGNIFIADSSNHRIRRVDGSTGIITRFAGNGDPYPFPGQPFSGDAGPATRASLAFPGGVAIDASGNLFIADSSSNRIRAVFACVDVAGPALLVPADGDTNANRTPTLAWTEVDGALSYDVLLDTESPPDVTVASDLSATRFAPQNLELGRTYFWQVVAKGDPFCEPRSSEESEIRSFTTSVGCGPPAAFGLANPGDSATIAGDSVTLAWNPASGASLYDVFFGTTDPPRFFRSTSAESLAVSGLVSGSRYFWTVVAHASCDSAQTTPAGTTRSFTVTGVCEPADPLELTAPPDGAQSIGTRTTLDWTDSPNASSYDLFLGRTSPPPLFLEGVRGTSLRISGLPSNTAWYWRVRANVDCDPEKSLTTTVASFTTGEVCPAPQASSIRFTPPGSVGVGQTYAITWSEAEGLDAGGKYVVERSLDSAFSTILDSQEVTTSSATFIAEAAGAHHHRVRPLMGCNPAVAGPNSAAVTVNIVAEESNVIFTVEPEAVITTPGSPLEEVETSFTLENIASEPIDVNISEGRIESVPFFFVRDPFGGQCCFGVTLKPREPKKFQIRFSGPLNDVPASYQGFVIVNVLGGAQRIVPYAFVNLKVGDQASASPAFRVAGNPTEYIFFPGFAGDDSGRPPISVGIHNPGSTPMELGAEIGPEVWLEPEAGWNDSPIPAGGTRTVDLFSKRTRSLADSALPRYTYFLVRTKTGESARLLVQDNDAASSQQSRSAALDPGIRTLLIPEIVSETSDDGTTLVSRVRLTNLGSDPVQAELIFTPSGTDGFSASVRRATVIVPANDVASLTDPLVQLFGLSRPAVGGLEIRAAAEKLGLLRVDATVVDGNQADAALVRIPTISRNHGARQGVAHEIGGVTRGESLSTCLILAETSGTDGAEVVATLFDSSGSTLGQTTRSVPRYGHIRIDDVVSSLAGGNLSAGRIDLTVSDGGGSVIGLAKIEHESGLATALVSRAVEGSASVSARRIASLRPDDGVTTTLVAPYVATGDVDDTGVEYSTLLGLQAPFGTSLDFRVTYGGDSGQSVTKTVSVPGGAIIEYDDVIEDLFEIPGPAEGSITIQMNPGGLAYSRLTANGFPSGAFDLISSVSELATNTRNATPLYVEGLEQSTDVTRGTRWNLYVREIGGKAGTLTIRLYEAGNRTHPIAIKDFSITPNGQLRLETIFDAMALNTEQRHKDRTNVLCVVAPKSGDAQLTAVAVEIDNVTGTATPHTLGPASGLSPDVSQFLALIIEPGEPSARRRPVRRTGGD